LLAWSFSTFHLSSKLPTHQTSCEPDRSITICRDRSIRFATSWQPKKVANLLATSWKPSSQPGFPTSSPSGMRPQADTQMICQRKDRPTNTCRLIEARALATVVVYVMDPTIKCGWLQYTGWVGQKNCTLLLLQ